MCSSVAAVKAALPNNKKRIQNNLRFFLTVFLTGLFFIFFFKKNDATQVLCLIEDVSRTKLGSIAVLSLFSAAILVPLEFRWILKAVGPSISFGEAMFIRMAAAPLKGVFPLKAGEFFVCGYLKWKRSVPVTQSLQTIMISMFLAAVVLLMIILTGLMFNGNAAALKGAAVLTVMAGTLVLAVRFLKQHGTNNRVRGFLERLTAVARFFRSEKRKILKILGLAILIELIEVIIFFSLARTLAIDIPFAKALFAVPAIMFITNLPFTLFGLGTRELAVLYFFFRQRFK